MAQLQDINLKALVRELQALDHGGYQRFFVGLEPIKSTIADELVIGTAILMVIPPSILGAYHNP